MVIYSTKLSTKKELTKERFAELVVKWNQESLHDKLNLKGVTNYLDLSVTEGKKNLTINELGSIVAARFEKEENAVVWTTYFILNYEEKKMACFLGRETTDALEKFTPGFNPPRFIRQVIEEGLVADDGPLPVTCDTHMIKREDFELVKSIVQEELKLELPVVYVTKTWEGNYPLKTRSLAKSLSGVAHVLIESDPKVGTMLAKDGIYKNVYRGQIGVYFPNKGFKYLKFSDKDYTPETLASRILSAAYRYSTTKHKGHMYTWDGVQNERLRLKNKEAVQMKTEYENEKQDLYEEFGEQLSDNESQIKALRNKIEALEAENNGLRAKLSNTNQIALINYGLEDDLYEGEIKDLVISSLKDAVRTMPEKSRRRDVIEDIIDNNEIDNVSEKKAEEIKHILKGYTKLDNSMRKELEEFGMKVEIDARHYRLTYYGDNRYIATMSKTASDGRTGSNLASIIKETML